MKKYLLSILVALTAICGPVALTSCSTAPSSRVVQVQTLKAVGASVDTSMKVLAELYRDGKITQEQWNKVADIHDRAFLPAYNLAVTAVQANLDSIASPDLINIATQLANAVLNYSTKPSAVFEPKIGQQFVCADGVNVRTYEGNGLYRETLVFVIPKTF